MIEWFGELTWGQPWRLVLLLPAAAVWLLWFRRRQAPSPWLRVVEPHLLAHLSHSHQGPSGGRQVIAPLLLAAALVLAVVALAEPRLDGGNDRLYQRTSAVQIILDLSTPGAPDTALDAALRQWLGQTRVPQVGLQVVAGSSHEVVPPTPDTAMVLRQLQWLIHESIPLPGLNLGAALEQAGTILERAELSNGAVVIIGEGTPDAAALRQAGQLASAGIPVHRVTVAGRVETGSSEAAGLTDRGGGHWWSADDFPGQDPLPRDRGAFTGSTPIDSGPNLRHLGPWLLLLLLLIGLLGLRRGWVLGLALLVVPPPLPALDWEDEAAIPRPLHEDPWRTRNQAAMALFREGEYSRAAALFQDREWRGVALYRAGHYLQAASAFATIDTPRAHYNRGNALARANRMGEAIAAYETALERDPDHEAARHNRDRVSAYLDSRRSVVQQQQDEAAEGRARHHPGPLLQDDPAEFWKRKFELDLRRGRGGEP